MNKLIGTKPLEATSLFSLPPTHASVTGEFPAPTIMLWKGTAAQARGAVLFHSQHPASRDWEQVPCYFCRLQKQPGWKNVDKTSLHTQIFITPSPNFLANTQVEQERCERRFNDSHSGSGIRCLSTSCVAQPTKPLSFACGLKTNIALIVFCFLHIKQLNPHYLSRVKSTRAAHFFNAFDKWE